MSRARDFADLAGSADAGGITGKNLVIGGCMRVAQRGTSVTGITSGGYRTCDRFMFSPFGPAGTWTVTQSTDAPDGFSNSFRIDCTTADASLGASDFVIVETKIEAQNVQHLRYGDSSAKTVTASFYVKSNKTGTYVLELRQPDSGRLYSKTYTIDAANTWEYKTLTFPGDVSGTINNDNGQGLNMNFWCAAGSTFSSGSIGTSWHTTNANRAAGVVNLADSTSNEWYITGVQLEVGEQATPFEHEPYSVTLQKAQRYCQVRSSEGVNYGVFAGGGLVDSNVSYFTIPHITTMRAAPSNSITGTFRVDTGNNTHTSFTFDRQTTHSLRAIVATSSITSSVGQLQADGTNTSTIISDAEL